MIIDKFIPGVYAVPGCGGWGKTKFLKTVERECVDNNVYCEFSDFEEDRSSKAKSMKMSSTESIVFSDDFTNIFFNIVSGISSGNAVAVWLIDNINGLDLANAVSIKKVIEKIKNIIEDTAKNTGRTIRFYVFLSASCYEIAANFNNIDPVSMESMPPFSNYDHYASYIMKCHSELGNRYIYQQENGNEKEISEWENFIW